MATRGDIRDAFYSELNSLAGDYTVTDAAGNTIRTVTLNADDIGLVEPESRESFPQIVYDDSYERVEHNGVGTAPDAIIDSNNDGVVDKEVWREYVEATFDVFVRAKNDVDKEPVYEALRRQFQRYQYPVAQKSNFHADVRTIDVLDATSVDSGDVEQVIRGDSLTVVVEFYREYDLTEENIDKIIHEMDLDTDSSTSGITSTTT